METEKDKSLSAISLMIFGAFIIAGSVGLVQSGIVDISRPFSGAASVGDLSGLNTKFQVPVLVLGYFPSQNGKLKRPDGGKILDQLDGADVRQVKINTQRLTSKLVEGLEYGTRYHGYQMRSTPGINYKIVKTQGLDTDYPRIPALVQNASSSSENFEIDYGGVLTQQGFDICRDYVDNPKKNVREVWLWTYGSPTQSAEFGISSKPINVIAQNYGSSTPRTLPVCNNSYTLLHLNYGREIGSALHSYGHYLERLFAVFDNELRKKFVGAWQYGGYDGYSSTTPSQWSDPSAPRRCGAVHAPPNAIEDYGYYNAVPHTSDCPNWNPNSDGATSTVLVSCATWSKAPNCKGRNGLDLTDGQPSWLIYWMQSMPGKGNTLTYQGRKMRNWWEIVADINKAQERGGLSLTYPNSSGSLVVYKLKENYGTSLTATSTIWIDQITDANKQTGNPVTISNLSVGTHIIWASIPTDKKYVLAGRVCYTTGSNSNCEAPFLGILLSQCVLSGEGVRACPFTITIREDVINQLTFVYVPTRFEIGGKVAFMTSFLNFFSLDPLIPTHLKDIQEIPNLPGDTIFSVQDILLTAASDYSDDLDTLLLTGRASSQNQDFRTAVSIGEVSGVYLLTSDSRPLMVRTEAHDGSTANIPVKINNITRPSPITFANVSGTYTVAAQDPLVSGFHSLSAGYCTFDPLVVDGCTVTSFPFTNLEQDPSCATGFCTIPAGFNVRAGRITKVVFRYISQ